ncbi:MAG TPA: HEAT repeat domain-containing protein [Terriglobales bacterium]|jgi:HEAT repeat protein
MLNFSHRAQWLGFWFALVCLTTSVAHAISGQEKAWQVLDSGIQGDNAGRRASAIRSLRLVPGNAHAVEVTVAALQDTDAEVRAAAASTAGELHITAATSKLQALLADEELSVGIAAARALFLLKNETAFDAYYEILTGQRKGKGLIASQLETLHDPQKLAEIGIGEAIGFVPFASIGWQAYRNIKPDDTSPARAAAATALADDPDPKSLEALKEATTDKSWIVRIAALEALAKRRNPALLGKIELSMYDERSEVRYTAAALVIHLTAAHGKKKSTH